MDIPRQTGQGEHPPTGGASAPYGAVDWLTGLPSMVRFHDLARKGARAIRKNGGQPVAIALDLVGMKSFNAQHGRREGDKLLYEFADVLRNYFGEGCCSRFAEDHYYAFASLEGVEERLEAVFVEFSEANELSVPPVRAGVYVCHAEDDIVDVGFDRAKTACDLDRKTWQSHVMWFSDEMRCEAEMRIRVLESVDRAINEKWVRPYYQAVVRAATGSICGEEALARWIDPEFGPLTPDQFVPVLEEAGLLYKLDMYIVDCVIADLLLKRKHGVEVVPVSVNISLRDFEKLDVVEELSRKVDAVGVPRSFLRVEFTESAVSDDLELLTSQIHALHEAGFKVWMDDFGSGYSSLNTLQSFEFDLIKLDMQFVSNLENEKARDIVLGVVKAAKHMGISTLAEGVETEEQAMYLEAIGCDVLQGFFYTKPLTVEMVIDRFLEGVGIPRESPHEFAYWSAIGAIDLADPVASIDGRAVDGAPLSEFPAGVVECRNGRWWLIRSNSILRDFLAKGGILPNSRPHLKAVPIEAVDDADFYAAIERSSVSGAWERIAGRLEYGTGFQFYARTVAAVLQAEAFAIAAVPNMLGTVLGSYGDVPVAYAVFRVMLNEAGDEVVDTEYIYANGEYCELGGYDHDSLTGCSFLDVNPNASSTWFSYCYRAAVLKEQIRDMIYSPEVGHWLSFRVAPSPVDGCCVYAFTIADEEQREREEMIIGLDTSDLIIDIAEVFAGERDYESAMNEVLDKMSDIINPKRLSVYERGTDHDCITFEWCAEGAVSRKGVIYPITKDDVNAWDRLSGDNEVIYIPDIASLRETDERLYHQLTDEGITHMLAAPLRNGGELVGYLLAENYEFKEGIDTKRLLEHVAPFMASRIVNQRLLAKLERLDG